MTAAEETNSVFQSSSPLEHAKAFLESFPTAKVFPLDRASRKHGYGNGTGKEPALKWQVAASRDLTTAEWKRPQITGFGAVFGNDHLIIDVDDHQHMPSRLVAALNANPTWKAQTPRPGLRFIYSVKETDLPEGFTSKKRQAPKDKPQWGDCRIGDAYFVVGPGSGWWVENAPDSERKEYGGGLLSVKPAPDEWIDYLLRGDTEEDEGEYSSAERTERKRLFDERLERPLGPQDGRHQYLDGKANSGRALGYTQPEVMAELKRAVKEDLRDRQPGEQKPTDKWVCYPEKQLQAMIDWAWEHIQPVVRRRQVPFFGRWDSDLLSECLRLVKCRLRLNVRSQMPEIDFGGGWGQVTDYSFAALFERIHKRVTIKVPKKTKQGEPPAFKTVPVDWSKSRRLDAFNAYLHEHPSDPFLVWLKQLPEWDGVVRLPQLIRRCGLIPTAETDEGLLEWASASPFLAAVARAFEPGEKYDEMVVFLGDKGIGKSMFWRWALPKEHQSDWFSDHLDMRASEKDKIESTQGKVIVECAELTGMTRGDIETLKAWTARQDDNAVRGAYKHFAEKRPRRFIVGGSSNDLQALPFDPSGNRRLIPIELAGGSGWSVKEWWQENRNQVWAEALARYEEGMRLSCPDETWAALVEASEHHQSRDQEAEECVLWYLDEFGTPVAVQELMTAVSRPPDPRLDSNGMPTSKPGLGLRLTNGRVIAQLKSLGLVRVRTRTADEDGRSVRVWVDKEDPRATRATARHHKNSSGGARNPQVDDGKPDRAPRAPPFP